MIRGMVCCPLILYSRDENLCHCHWLPSSLKGQPIRYALAEGDWGL